jgi:hypothetical protein
MMIVYINKWDAIWSINRNTERVWHDCLRISTLVVLYFHPLKDDILSGHRDSPVQFQFSHTRHPIYSILHTNYSPVRPTCHLLLLFYPLPPSLSHTGPPNCLCSSASPAFTGTCLPPRSFSLPTTTGEPQEMGGRPPSNSAKVPDLGRMSSGRWRDMGGGGGDWATWSPVRRFSIGGHAPRQVDPGAPPGSSAFATDKDSASLSVRQW